MKESSKSGSARPSVEDKNSYDAEVDKELSKYQKQKEEKSNPENEEVNGIIEQAREVQRVAEKIYFLTVLKRFGLAFAGILLLLGIISAAGFFLLFLDVFTTDLPKNIELVIEIGLVMLSVIHILSGLVLLAK